MSTNGKHGVTVTGVEVENFRRIRLARVELIPGKGLVRITGRNGSGKTSLLDSLKAALGGAGEILPESIHDASEDGTGQIRIRLSNDFTVTRRFTEAAPKGYLTVESEDGGRYGQAKLAEWLGPLSFDPLAFFQLRPDRQREILLSLGDDPELASKIDELRARREELYQKRTPWISQKRRARQIEKPGGERPDPVDTSAEMQRMGELQAAERERQDAFRKVHEQERELERMKAQRDETRQKIEELRAQLARLEDAFAKQEHRVRDAGRELNVLRDEANELPDPSAEMEQVRARINEADRIRDALEPWRRWDEAQAELEEAEVAIDDLTSAMDELEREEAELIANAGIPIEAIGFTDEGEPLLNDRPLEVASGAERIQMAVRVALAANPDLRICLVDEANDIDLEGLEELDRLAEEHGFQVWAARIGLEGPGEVVVDDGEAWDRDAPREEPEAVA